jgi:hypothetical protein
MDLELDAAHLQDISLLQGRAQGVGIVEVRCSTWNLQ